MRLLRTAAHAAVAGSVVGRVQRRQHGRWAQPDQAQEAAVPIPEAQASPPASPASDDVLTQLQKLGDLRAAGVLTDAEFETQKARILSS